MTHKAEAIKLVEDLTASNKQFLAELLAANENFRETILELNTSLRENLTTTNTDVTTLKVDLGNAKSDISTLKTDDLVVTKDVATLKGSFNLYSIIFAAIGFVLTLITTIGGFDYFKSRAEMQSAISRANESILQIRQEQESIRAIRNGYNVLIKNEYVNKIDGILSEQESLDRLKDKQNEVVMKELSRYAVELKIINRELDSKEQDSFYNIVEALEKYNIDDHSGALQALMKVETKDQMRYNYYYTKGACLLRLGDRQEAAECFVITMKLSSGIQQARAINANGMAKLYEWKATGTPRFLNDAIGVFIHLCSQHTGFGPGYFDLACAYAQKGAANYKDVSASLGFCLTKAHWSIDELIDRIAEDVVRPRESFLNQYVEDYLKITQADPADRAWRNRIEKALFDLMK